MIDNATVGELLVDVMMVTARRFEAEIAELKTALEELQAKALPDAWRDVTPRPSEKAANLWRNRYERLREAVEPIRYELELPRQPVAPTEWIGVNVTVEQAEELLQACKKEERT